MKLCLSRSRREPRWIAALLALFLLFNLSAPVYADESGSSSQPDSSASSDAPEKSEAAEKISVPAIKSESAVLMAADNGQVLYQKNSDKQMQPASITKIVTAIVALESGVPLDEKITVSQNAVDSVPRSSTHIALDVGETLPLEDALYALMLASANDAAVCIAERVAGTTEKFVEKMNELAAKVGAVNTHFTNPHGLIDRNHYTSAYDMALLTRYAMENEEFVKIFSTVTYEAEPTNKQPEKRIWSNQNDMIKNTTYKYDGAIGGKLGYTEEALYTIVTAAERSGRKLICVCMKSDPYAQQYQDAAVVLDFGFDSYKKVEMTAEDLPYRTVTFAVKADEKVKTPATAQILTSAKSIYYLPRGLSKDDCEITFNVRERENILENCSPMATVTLKNAAKEIPSVIQVPLDTNVTGAVPEESAEGEKSGNSGTFMETVKKVAGAIWKVLKWVLLVLLILLVLLVLLRMWFVYQAKQKKKARLERERRRKAMMRQRDQQVQAYLRKEEIRRQMRRSGSAPPTGGRSRQNRPR